MIVTKNTVKKSTFTIIAATDRADLPNNQSDITASKQINSGTNIKSPPANINEYLQTPDGTGIARIIRSNTIVIPAQNR